MNDLELMDNPPITFMLFLYSATCLSCDYPRSQLNLLIEELNIPILQLNCDGGNICQQLHIENVPAIAYIEDDLCQFVSEQPKDYQHFRDLFIRLGLIKGINEIFITVPKEQLNNYFQSYNAIIQVLPGELFQINSGYTSIIYNNQIDVKDIYKYALLQNYVVTKQNFSFLVQSHKIPIFICDYLILPEQLYDNFVLAIADSQTQLILNLQPGFGVVVWKNNTINSFLILDQNIYQSMLHLLDHDKNQRQNYVFYSFLLINIMLCGWLIMR